MSRDRNNEVPDLKPDPVRNNDYVPVAGNPYANPFAVTRRTPVTGTRWDGVTKS